MGPHWQWKTSFVPSGGAGPSGGAPSANAASGLPSAREPSLTLSRSFNAEQRHHQRQVQRTHASTGYCATRRAHGGRQVRQHTSGTLKPSVATRAPPLYTPSSTEAPPGAEHSPSIISAHQSQASRTPLPRTMCATRRPRLCFTGQVTVQSCTRRPCTRAAFAAADVVCPMPPVTVTFTGVDGVVDPAAAATAGGCAVSAVTGTVLGAAATVGTTAVAVVIDGTQPGSGGTQRLQPVHRIERRCRHERLQRRRVALSKYHRHKTQTLPPITHKLVTHGPDLTTGTALHIPNMGRLCTFGMTRHGSNTRPGPQHPT